MLRYHAPHLFVPYTSFPSFQHMRFPLLFTFIPTAPNCSDTGISLIPSSHSHCYFILSNRMPTYHCPCFFHLYNSLFPHSDPFFPCQAYLQVAPSNTFLFLNPGIGPRCSPSHSPLHHLHGHTVSYEPHLVVSLTRNFTSWFPHITHPPCHLGPCTFNPFIPARCPQQHPSSKPSLTLHPWQLTIIILLTPPYLGTMLATMVTIHQLGHLASTNSSIRISYNPFPSHLPFLPFNSVIFNPWYFVFGFMHPYDFLWVYAPAFFFGFMHPCFLFWVYAPVFSFGFTHPYPFWVFAPVFSFGFTHPCPFLGLRTCASLGLCTRIFLWVYAPYYFPLGLHALWHPECFFFFFRVTIHPYGCVLPFVWRTFDICLGLCSFSGCIHILCLGLRTCSLFSGNFRSSLVHLLIFSWIMHPILCLPTTLISSVLMIVWASAPTNFIWGYSLLRL